MHVYSTKLNVIVRVFSLTCVGLLLGTRGELTIVVDVVLCT